MTENPKRLFGVDRILLAVLLIYAIVQMSYLILYSSLPEWNQLTVDNHYHHNWARSIADGNIVGDTTYFRAPFYVWCLAAVYALLFPDIWFARLFGLLIGLGIITMTYQLALRLYDRRAAVVAAVIASLYPALIYFNAELLLDPLFTLFVLCCVYRFFIFEESSTNKNAAWLGVAIGLAAITRPTILIIAPLFVVWHLYQTHRFEFRQWLIVAAASLALILPITVRNIVVAGDPVLIASQGGVNFFIGNNAAADGVSAVMPEPMGWNWQMPQVEHIAEQHAGQALKPGEVSSYWSSEGWNWIVSHQVDAAKLFARKLAFALSDREISNNRDMDSFFEKVPLLGMNPLGFGLLFSLAVAGSLFGSNRRSLFLGLFSIFFLLSVCIFFYASRFRLPIIPILIVLASHGFFVVWQSIMSGVRRWGVVFALLAVSGVITYVPWVHLKQATFSQDSMSKGLYALSQKDYLTAREIFASVVSSDSTYPDANLNLGVSLLKLGYTDSAMIAFIREAKLNPGRHKAFINISSLTLLAGRYADAESAARRATSVAPWDPQGWLAMLRVTYARDSGNLTPLTAIADTAAQATSNDISVLTEVGALLGGRGSYALAERYLRIAVAAPPPPVESDDRLFGAMGGSPEMIWEQSKAGAWFQLGFIAGINQRFGEAIECTKKAIDRDSLNERAWVNLVAAYRSTNQDERADSLVGEFSRRFPQSQFLNRL